MFMSLLTADAAAQHGHEYSPQREPSPTARPFYYLPRSISSLPAAGLRTLSYMSGAQSEETKQTTGSESSCPAKVQRSISFADDVPSSVDHRSEPAEQGDHGLTRTPSLSSVSTTQAGVSPAIRPADSSSNRARRRSRKDGSSRPKQSLNFAHPPPLGSKYQRLHIKPRLLLQLQEVAPSGRPRPAFEVVPSSRLPVRITRKFARLHHNVNTALGSDDMVVCEVKGHQAYTDEEDWDAREPLGLLRMTADGNVDINMNDGSIWRSSPRNRGRYDFVYHDEHGVPRTVRWVSKPVRKISRSDSSSSPVTPVPDTRRFVFSSILPDSRQHPIIATLTPTGMEIFTHYKVPGKRDRSEVATPSESDMQTDDDCFDEDAEAPGSFPIETDDLLRQLILLSGIWVCMQERWSTAPRAVTQAASSQSRTKRSSGACSKLSSAEGQAESPRLEPVPEKPRPVSLHLPRRNRQAISADTFAPPSTPALRPARTLSLIVPKTRADASPSGSNSSVTPMTPISMPATPIQADSPSTTSDKASRRATTGHTLHRLAHVLPSRRHSASFGTFLEAPTIPLQTIPSGIALEEEPPDELDTTAGAAHPAYDGIPTIRIPSQPEGWQTPEAGTPTGYSVSIDGGGSDAGERKKKWGTLRRVMTLGRSRKGKNSE